MEHKKKTRLAFCLSSRDTMAAAATLVPRRDVMPDAMPGVMFELGASSPVRLPSAHLCPCSVQVRRRFDGDGAPFLHKPPDSSLQEGAAAG